MLRPRVEVTRDDMNRAANRVEIPVNWSEVLRRCDGLRGLGRDLRLLVVVTRAHANERGFAGLADGLTLIAKTIELHWETLFPEARAASDPVDAAFRRLNALAALQTGEGVLADLRRRQVFEVRGLGMVSGEDLERAAMEVAEVLAGLQGISEETRAAETERQEQLILRVRAAGAALAENDPERLAAEAVAATAALQALDAVEAALAAHIGGGSRLPDLGQFLRRVTGTLDRARASGVAPEAAAPADAADTGQPTAGPPRAAAAVPGQVASREDVIRMLDRIIEFYDRTEPSSPVPFLARRMRQMVPMNFLQLIEDLAPGGVKEFRTLAGIPDDKAKNRSTSEKS